VGTALTLDALAADGRHLGGLIAPGPRLMQQSLLGATAQVRPAQAGTIVEAADNTADAVASGCWLAAAALIERFAARMAPALGGAPALRLGGGDAEALLPLLAARRNSRTTACCTVWRCGPRHNERRSASSSFPRKRDPNGRSMDARLRT